LRRAAAAIAAAGMPVLTRLDPELAHDLGLAGLKVMRPLWPAWSFPAECSVRCFGLQFAHSVGLAAGFDKNGDYLDALGALGFSHIELGTVTPRPQPGNPKPRMFRIPGNLALINRMGFNNKGVDHLITRLSGSRYRGIRGISIGKNFSSPNTARLRELQDRDGLQRILGTLLEERVALQERHGKRVPLLVKVAPDLSEAQVSELAQQLRSLQPDGVIATNTSSDLNVLGKPAAEHRGGLSGAPLHPLSVKVISQLRAELGADFPIIGVGGIVSAANARETLRAGANLLQVYTGFAYRGTDLLEELIGSPE